MAVTDARCTRIRPRKGCTGARTCTLVLMILPLFGAAMAIRTSETNSHGKVEDAFATAKLLLQPASGAGEGDEKMPDTSRSSSQVYFDYEGNPVDLTDLIRQKQEQAATAAVERERALVATRRLAEDDPCIPTPLPTFTMQPTREGLPIHEPTSSTSYAHDSQSYSGTIPSELGLYTSVTIFTVKNNELTGTVPTELGLLDAAEQFLIRQNALTGTIPSQLGNLDALTSNFRLDTNSFTSTIPSELGKVTKLGYRLQIYSNKLGGTVPTELGKLSKVSNYFSLHDNQMCADIPTEVEALSSAITNYNVGADSIGTPCDFDDVWPKLPSVLPSQTRSMGGFATSSFTGTIPTEFGLLTKITSMPLLRNTLNGTIPTELGNLVQLVGSSADGFLLQTNKLSGAIPSELGNLDMEARFLMQSNTLSYTIPSELGRLVKMTSGFYLSTNNLCSDIPTEVEALSSVLGTTYSVESNNPIGTVCGWGDTMGDSRFPSMDGKTSTTTIDYKQQGLTGTLPTEFGLMTEVTKLDVGENRLSGDVPTELGNLFKLNTTFYMSTNEFSSAIPSQLGRLINFVGMLALQEDGFNRAIPTELGHLDHMSAGILLGNNNITSSIPTELGNLENMRDSFELASNRVCADVPTEVQALSMAVSSWSVTTGNEHLGTLCCEAMPDRFTCAPTSLPTPAPTLLPTQAPTQLNGTGPSPIPTLSPTLLPTIGCALGQYLTDDDACVDCAIGEYSTSRLATTCDVCPDGTYNNKVGQSTCSQCVPGKYSNDDRTSCNSCDAGSYVYTFKVYTNETNATAYNTTACVDCPYGRYASTPQDRECLECVEGFYTGAMTKAVTCTACNAGKYSHKNSHNCSSCTAGRYSTSKASSCQACEAGTYSVTNGADACTKCAGGRYSSQTNQTSCQPCPAGRAQGATGQPACVVCDEGKYNDDSTNGVVTCTRCAEATEYGPAYTSTAGSSTCDRTTDGYYMTSSGKAEQCPDGVDCNDQDDVVLETMEILKHWYRFSASATELYLCPNKNCKGYTPTNESRRRRLLQDHTYDADWLCNEGSHGPLCTLCDGDHYLDSSSGGCLECTVQELVGPLIGFAVVGVGCTAIVLLRTWIARWAERNKRWLPQFGERLLLFVVTMQIIVILKFNHTSVGGKEMEEPYAGFVELLSAVDIDLPRLIPFNCLVETEWNHFESLKTVTVVPVVFFISVSILIVCLSPCLSTNGRAQAQMRFNYCFIRALLVGYPAISRQICQCFRCDEYDRGTDGGFQSLLKADLSIDCNTTMFRTMFAYASVCCFAYCVGIPAVVFLKLFRWRRALNPPYEDTARAVRARLKNKAMMADPIVTLALPFKPRYWWFEVFSLGRRFVLTSVVLAFSTWQDTTVYTIITLVSVHIVEREWAPLIDPAMGNYSHGLSWQIVMSVIYMLFLDAEVLAGPSAVYMSVGLLVFNVSLMGVIGASAATAIQEQVIKDLKLEKLRQQLLKDKSEDKEKFGKAWNVLIETGAPGDEQRLLAVLRQLASKTALGNGKQPTPRHKAQYRGVPVADIDELLAEADEIATEFHSALKGIVETYGGEYQQGPNKSRARAVEKIENDYGGDHTKLVDVVRSSAVFYTFAQLTLAVQALLDEGCTLNVCRAKDRFNNPTDFGYKDMLLNLQLQASDHVGELQLHLGPIIAIKPACHRTYALMRAVGWEVRTRACAHAHTHARAHERTHESCERAFKYKVTKRTCISLAPSLGRTTMLKTTWKMRKKMDRGRRELRRQMHLRWQMQQKRRLLWTLEVSRWWDVPTNFQRNRCQRSG
mmetsp:Transcript_24999/g.57947  ORF Transcript_24999/g.57947 Transcript_24999/m.57947 type:complete len:1793 (+) Transcript_24999:178-5556(+)